MTTARWIYLLEARPLTISASPAEVDLRYCTGDKTRPLRLDGRVYRPRLESGPTFTVDAFHGPKGIIGGASIPGRGTLQIVLGDAEDDALATYAWAGAPVVVKRGREGAAYGDYLPVVTGTARHVTWDPDALTIHLRDLGEVLNVAVQNGKYGGTGGADGEAVVKDHVKPLRYGTVKLAEAKLINPVKLIYQFHDPTNVGIADSPTVDAIYDQGRPIGFGAAFTTYAGLEGWTPVAGQYARWNAGGMFRLGASPEGVVVASTGSSRTSAADIIETILLREGILTASDLDADAFDALNDVQPAQLGIVINESRTIASVLDEICATIGAFWTWTPAGKLRVVRMEFPPPADVTIPARALQRWTRTRFEDRIARVATAVPPYRVRFGYARTWRVHTREELALSVRDPETSPGVPNLDYLEAAYSAYRYTTDIVGDEATIRAIYPLSEELQLDTLFANEADAQEQAGRLKYLLTDTPNPTGSRRVDQYDLEVRGYDWQLALGTGVEFSYDRWGLEGGFRGLLLGIGEDAKTELTKLSLYGSPVTE